MLVLVLEEEECPSCEEVVEELRGLQNEFPDMHLRRRNLDDEPELVTRLGVVAAPAIVVNQELAFQGHPGADAVRTYLRNVGRGLHGDPEAYPLHDERHPENVGQEATGSQDPEWKGHNSPPSHRGTHGGRHS
jgi:hypothetical protein